MGIIKKGYKKLETDIVSYINKGLKKGYIDEYEAEFLMKLYRTRNKKAGDVMIKRQKVVAAKSDITFEALVQLFTESGLSRLPVYEKTLDNIIGIIYIKDLIKLLNQEEKNIIKVLRNPYFVPESKNIRELFKEMRDKHIHLAVVFDEYGGVTGVITIEDIMEEIFGEIYDEVDTEKKEMFEIKDGIITADGEWDIEELNQHTGVEIKKENFETLGGFLVHLLNRIPSNGERIKYKNLLFTIEESDERKVKKVRIEILEE
jgi:CBS domain containing-hemolysin-like protein